MRNCTNNSTQVTPDPYTKFSSIKPMNHEDLILRDLMETSDEIYDIPEMQDDKFDVEEYINSDYDF